MKKLSGLTWFLLLFGQIALGQARYTSANVHSHNDYQQPVPFHNAYRQKAGSIEADVFLKNNELYVAHELKEISPDRTLDALYLKPLQQEIRKNKGTAYPNAQAVLQILIDLKTPGATTLPVLVQKLENYPEIKNNRTVQIVISGDKPDPSTWATFPEFIHFDGLPGQIYNPEQSKRVPLVSANFRKYSRWNGKGQIEAAELTKIKQLVDSVHHQNQKMRFWATPDNANSWQTLMNLGVDFIGTDAVTELTTFIKTLPASKSKSASPGHSFYPLQYQNNYLRKNFKTNKWLHNGLSQGYVAGRNGTSNPAALKIPVFTSGQI